MAGASFGGSALRVLSLAPPAPIKRQEIRNVHTLDGRNRPPCLPTNHQEIHCKYLTVLSMITSVKLKKKKGIKKMQTKSSALCLGPKVKPRAAPLGAVSRHGVPQAEGTAPATPRASPFQKPVLEAEGREAGRRRVATNPLSFPALCLQRRETVGTQYGAP